MGEENKQEKGKRGKLVLNVINGGREISFRCPVCGTSIIATDNEGRSNEVSARCYHCKSFFAFDLSEWLSGTLKLQINTTIEVYQPGV